MHPASSIAASIRAHASRPASSGRTGPALVPYITAGFPTREAFRSQLQSIAPHAALIEIGVPFSDPMADGVTIQRSSRVALERGVTLDWILSELQALRDSLRPAVPLCLMSYLNPLLSIGLDQLGPRCARAGVAALIIPDLPFEESPPLRSSINTHGVGLVQLVSPVTPPDRAARIAAHSDGFLYAVTITGVTGANSPTAALAPESTAAYLARLRSVSPVPVCAGFGIRTRDHVAALTGAADGAIIGSALIEAIERGENPGDFLAALKP